MNDAEQANNVVFVSLDGLVVSVINSSYQEVALLSVSSVPAVWEVEVNNRWKILNVELQTWLEDQWRNKQGQTNLQEQFEVGIIEKKSWTLGYIGFFCTYFFAYKTDFLSLQNYPKSVDPSFKMDLYLLDC